MKQPAVYLLASRPCGTLYTGVTSHLPRRIWQHRTSQAVGFTSRHRICHLVWFELHPTMGGAIAREKRIKKWRRAWKIALIERGNPTWRDLWPSLAPGASDGFPLARE